jgi:hypothetical protein
MKYYQKLLLLIASGLSSWALTVSAADSGGYSEMYRLYQPANMEHFYTASANERDTLVKQHGWKYEGVGWIAPKKSNVPVYRLYNPILRDHHYTTSKNEKNVLVAQHGWNDEGIGWYSSDTKQVPVYRAFNPTLTSGSHNYTKDSYEQKILTTQRGWKAEGISWYGVTSVKQDKNTFTSVVIDGAKHPVIVKKASSYSVKVPRQAKYQIKNGKLTVTDNAKTFKEASGTIVITAPKLSKVIVENSENAITLQGIKVERASLTSFVNHIKVKDVTASSMVLHSMHPLITVDDSKIGSLWASMQEQGDIKLTNVSLSKPSLLFGSYADMTLKNVTMPKYRLQKGGNVDSDKWGVPNQSYKGLEIIYRDGKVSVN